MFLLMEYAAVKCPLTFSRNTNWVVLMLFSMLREVLGEAGIRILIYQIPMVAFISRVDARRVQCLLFPYSKVYKLSFDSLYFLGCDCFYCFSISLYYKSSQIYGHELKSTRKQLHAWQ